MSILFALLFASPTLLLPQDGAVVPTHTDLQKEFLNLAPRAVRIEKYTDKEFRKRLAPKYGWYPLPTELSWKAEGECEVKVARKADGRVVFTDTTREGRARVDNLEIACEYVWSVKSVDGEASATFRTEDEAPRLLRVPHIENMRDLGGRIGLDGRRVRQNLVFRNTGLNDNASRRPKDRDEVAKADPTGALLVAGDQILEYRDGLKKFRTERAGFVFPKYELPKHWTCASIANDVDFMDAAMLAVTGRFPDGDRSVEVNESGLADFAKSGCTDWIGLTGVLTAESDGFAYLGASADWYWSLEINGRLVRCLLDGNSADSNHPAHKILVPVKKGENRIRVLLGRGDAGFTFLLREEPVDNRDRILEHELAKLKEVPVKLVGESKDQIPGKSHIGDDNRDYLLKTLGIRSEIDLRSDGECYGMTGSPLGAEVTWYHYSFSAYAGMQTRRGREAFAKVFRVFLDEKNYPIDFHCIAGQDRTGSVAFALNALLGVGEEQLYLDWEATAFWNSNVTFAHQNLFDKLVEGFEKNYPEGRTINEKVELYVKSLGFTDDDIAKFRGIMLEPPACPVGDLVFDAETSDEFDGVSLDVGKWDDWVWSFRGRRQGFLFARDNVAVTNGCLRLTARALRDDEKTVENLRSGFDKYATAIVKAKAKTHYGYYECRAKAMKACVCNAFWLYDPLSDSPAKFASGDFSEEIDVFEIFGAAGQDEARSKSCERACFHTVHCLATPYLEATCNGGVEQLADKTKTSRTDFDFWSDYHVFGFLWTERELVWYIDGKETFRRTNDRFHRPLHVTFDCEVMFGWTGEPLPVDLPSVYTVEYFRHWKPRVSPLR